MTFLSIRPPHDFSKQAKIQHPVQCVLLCMYAVPLVSQVFKLGQYLAHDIHNPKERMQILKGAGGEKGATALKHLVRLETKEK